MPIYEYKCEKCGQFEVTQKITDRPISRCPTCKGKVKKLISHTSFQLKGTGWYVTDYARKDKDSKREKAPATEAKGNGKVSAGTEAVEKSSAEKKSDKPASSDVSQP